jgi:hypothetical protein
MRMLIAVLAIVATELLGEAHFRPQAEDPRETIALYEECMKLNDSKSLPGCRKFFRPEPFQQGEAAGKSIQFCDLLKVVNAPACSCRSNAVDVECTFRICGYPEGYYRNSNLPAFAAHVAEELNSWGPSYLVVTKFVGFADGTAWGEEKRPKPQPISESLNRCLSKATREHAAAINESNQYDYLDAQLALLRGCALEEELAQNIKSFEFDSTPSFSFESRKAGISDPGTRAAELKVVVANGCGRLALWQSQMNQ